MRADMREVEPVQQLPDIARVVVHAKVLLDDAFQVNASPTHDTVNGTVRAFLHDRSQFGLLLR